MLLSYLKLYRGLNLSIHTAKLCLLSSPKEYHTNVYTTLSCHTTLLPYFFIDER